MSRSAGSETDESITCPICDYPRLEPKYRLSDRFFGATSEEFVLYHCRSCSTICLDERQVASRLADFYPPGYWWSDSGGRVSGLVDRYRAWMVKRDQLRFLNETSPEHRGLRLLDVGSGGGGFLRAAIEAGWDAYGLEQSEEACQLAERQAPGRVLRATESELVEKGETFDVVTLFHVLEHIPSPFKYLRNLQKLMARPAKLIVQVPNNGSLQARIFGRRWYGLDCPRHVYNYNPYSVMHLLGRAGFRVRKVRHFSLRDNAAAIASSLLPGLDPMSQRVRLSRRTGRPGSLLLTMKMGAYFGVFMACQPLAWLESRLGRGGTITLYTTLDEEESLKRR